MTLRHAESRRILTLFYRRYSGRCSGRYFHNCALYAVCCDCVAADLAADAAQEERALLIIMLLSGKLSREFSFSE